MKLREALNELKEAQADYHKRAEGGKLTGIETAKETAKLKGMREKISTMIGEGAKDCPADKEHGPPVGLFHDGTPNPFELGCPACGNKRVRGVLPEDVVDKWNAGEYMPPREPGTAVAQIRRADGSVREERTMRVVRPTPAAK